MIDYDEMEVAECPFCEEEAGIITISISGEVVPDGYVQCKMCEAMGPQGHRGSTGVPTWAHRPKEEALKAETRELVEVLRNLLAFTKPSQRDTDEDWLCMSETVAVVLFKYEADDDAVKAKKEAELLDAKRAYDDAVAAIELEYNHDSRTI